MFFPPDRWNAPLFLEPHRHYDIIMSVRAVAFQDRELLADPEILAYEPSPVTRANTGRCPDEPGFTGRWVAANKEGVRSSFHRALGVRGFNKPKGVYEYDWTEFIA